MVAPNSKLIRVTTDGKRANTGLIRGLWKLMKNWLHRDLLTFWCSVHRSDLSFKSIEGGVSELRLAIFFSTSKKTTKLLHHFQPKANHFPAHYEV